MPATSARKVHPESAKAAARSLDLLDAAPETVRRTGQLLILMASSWAPLIECRAQLDRMTDDQVRGVVATAGRFREAMPRMVDTLSRVAAGRLR